MSARSVTDIRRSGGHHHTAMAGTPPTDPPESEVDVEAGPGIGTDVGPASGPGPDQSTDSQTLVIEFCGEEWLVGPDDHLDFGRAAGLTIDESNRYLHRRAGCFRHRADRWWLRNEGSHLPLSVLESVGRPMVVLPPGVETALSPGEFAVVLAAGPTRYELRGRCPDPHAPVSPLDDPTPGETELDYTVPWGVFELNDDQRALLAALAEPRLRDPLVEPERLPPNRQTAMRLGWTLSKFNRKLDHLCGRLSRHGVRGLQGRVGTTANDRRQNLVEHALAHQLVQPADLALLDDLKGTR